MGDFRDLEGSWKKMVIAKTNNKWKTTMKTEMLLDTPNTSNDEDYSTVRNIKQEQDGNDFDQNIYDQSEEPEEMVQDLDPLMIEPSLNQRRHKQPVLKNESEDERAARLAKMSAYAARRLANESPEQRATRLKRMSEYAAKRLAQETSEQRARRLSRMSAYAAKRLAKESPEQRTARLARMSAYAARRQAEKKNLSVELDKDPSLILVRNNIMRHVPKQS